MSTKTIEALLETTLRTAITPDVCLCAVEERPGPQGFSGAALRYYDVTYDQNDTRERTTLLTKEASLVERRTLDMLQRRTPHVPWNYAADLMTDAPLPVCMQYIDDSVGVSEEKTRQAAQALASVHAASLGRGGDLGWLPRADVHFVEQFIVDDCWRRGWESVRTQQRFIDGFGNDLGPIKAGGDFMYALQPFTPAIEEAATRLVETTRTLWDEGSSLTLVHADFHGEHVRFQDGRGYVIDWGEAHYGSFYIDLANYFTRDEALLYRDALAEQGHDVPVAEFLTHYDAVRPYVGFKYFGIGLWNWCYSDTPHRTDDVLHFINMIVEQPVS